MLNKLGSSAHIIQHKRCSKWAWKLQFEEHEWLNIQIFPQLQLRSFLWGENHGCERFLAYIIVSRYKLAGLRCLRYTNWMRQLQKVLMLFFSLCNHKCSQLQRSLHFLKTSWDFPDKERNQWEIADCIVLTERLSCENFCKSDLKTAKDPVLRWQNCMWTGLEFCHMQVKCPHGEVHPTVYLGETGYDPGKRSQVMGNLWVIDPFTLRELFVACRLLEGALLCHD